MQIFVICAKLPEGHEPVVVVQDLAAALQQFKSLDTPENPMGFYQLDV